MPTEISGSRSIWEATSPHTNYPKLSEDLETDVAIIGGGISGITTAYMLKQAGKKVVLIESRTIASDVTGHTTAKITVGHQLVYADLKKKFGLEKAKTYLEANQWGIEWIAEQVQKHSIDCDFERKKMYVYSPNGEENQKIEEEYAVLKEMGTPATLEETAGLPFSSGKAICYPNQAQFHPRTYLLHLAEEINKDGSIIFEKTRGIDVKEEKDHCIVKTSNGTVKAKHVVVATHFPIFDPGFYFARLAPYMDYALAVEVRGEISSEMYIEASEKSFAIRSQNLDGKPVLIISGITHKVGQGGDTNQCYAELEEYARSHFDVASIHYRWSTQDNGTLDTVPYIGKISPRSKKVYVVTGFGGWGMAAGTYAAKIITDLIQDKANPWSDFFDPNRLNVASLKSLVKENVNNVGGHFIGDRLKPDPKEFEDLKPGEARKVEIDGERIGVHRDKGGKLHAVSRVCTHMGCLLEWNPAEYSWDCPCHGSRFTYEGEVMHGPAVKDLEKVEV